MTLQWQLTEVFSMLSLLAVGGGTAVLPEMQSMLHQHFGFSHTQFVHAYSMGQIAPGPNMLSVLIMGELIDGLSGAAVALLAFFVPSSILCVVAGRLWAMFKDSPWRHSVERTLAPISLGLMCSGLYTVAHEALVSIQTYLIAAGVLFLLFKSRLSSVTLILMAGIVSVLIHEFQ